MREFNKEGRKVGKELSADLLPAFLLSLFNHPEAVARDAKWNRICSALNPNGGRLLSSEANQTVKVLAAKVDAPSKGSHLTQFAKDTAEVLGYSVHELTEYLIDTGVVFRSPPLIAVICFLREAPE